jgi:hypothetical protein
MFSTYIFTLQYLQYGSYGNSRFLLGATYIYALLSRKDLTSVHCGIME